MGGNHKAEGKVNAPLAEALKLQDLVAYNQGAIVSREVLKRAAGTVSVFSFDRGQGLSEHTSPYDAMVHLLEGQAELVIGGKKLSAAAGETVIMPADVPHALFARERFKMLLIMIRG